MEKQPLEDVIVLFTFVGEAWKCFILIEMAEKRDAALK